MTIARWPLASGAKNRALSKISYFEKGLAFAYRPKSITLIMFPSKTPSLESCVSTGVSKPVTDRHDMTIAVKVALNSNTTKLSSAWDFYLCDV